MNRSGDETIKNKWQKKKQSESNSWWNAINPRRVAQELRFPCLAAAIGGEHGGGRRGSTTFAINCYKFCRRNYKLHFRFGCAATRAVRLQRDKAYRGNDITASTAPPPSHASPGYILWSSVRKCFSFPFVFILCCFCVNFMVPKLNLHCDCSARREGERESAQRPLPARP